MSHHTLLLSLLCQMHQLSSKYCDYVNAESWARISSQESSFNYTENRDFRWLCHQCWQVRALQSMLLRFHHLHVSRSMSVSQESINEVTFQTWACFSHPRVISAAVSSWLAVTTLKFKLTAGYIIITWADFFPPSANVTHTWDPNGNTRGLRFTCGPE